MYNGPIRVVRQDGRGMYPSISMICAKSMHWAGGPVIHRLKLSVWLSGEC